MTAPGDKEIFESDIATYWFEEGILVSLSKSTQRTVDNLTGNIALVKKITGNQTYPLLIYLTNSPVPDKATRKFASEKLGEIYAAMAMISPPGLAKFIMNILFALKPPPIPMKSFTDAKAGRQWLGQFVQEKNQASPTVGHTANYGMKRN